MSGTDLAAQATDLRKWLESKRNSFGTLPKHMNIERLEQMAFSCCIALPRLLQCDRLTLWQALNDCANLGLYPGASLGEAYILPFGKTATFVLGYKGLVKLVTQSGHIDTIAAAAVYNGDSFDWSHEFGGPNDQKPWLRYREGFKHNAADTDQITHFWCVMTSVNGGSIIKVMSKANVDAIRDRSPSAKNKTGPWFNKPDYPAMGCKTVLKRAATMTPMSSELLRAITQDDAMEANVGTPDTGLLDETDLPTPETLDDVADQVTAKGAK